MMVKKKGGDAPAKSVEEEIGDLQRKFRTLENDKRQCSEDNQGTIRKQRATIEKLTRENRKMKAELNDTRSSSGAQAETKMALDTIQKMKEQKDSLDVRMSQELDFSERLTGKLDMTNKEIFKVRGEMQKNGGINASLDNAKAVQKQIRTLENRLDKALQKFNEAIAANTTLRDQIDTLRRERVVFDDIYQKLQNELQQKKKEMAHIIEQANAAYEARDQAQAQMAQLKQQADREHAEFEKEWRELGKLIQNDKKMKDFMRSKVRDAKALTDEAKEDEKKKTKVARNAWDTSRSLAARTENEEKITSYEEAFSQIQCATGVDDLEKLVQKFIDAEDQNFTLFKYNNELSADSEKLDQQISDYKEEYVQLSGTGSKREDTDKMKILETLDEKFHDVDLKARQYEEKYKDSKATLEKLGGFIANIFRLMQCQQTELPSGCGAGITETNMLQYLAVIENHTDDRLRVWEAVREGQGEDLETTRPPRPGASSATLQVNKLPSTVEDYSDDEDDDDDDESRPFTVEELKAKTRGKVKRAAAKTKVKGRS